MKLSKKECELLLETVNDRLKSLATKANGTRDILQQNTLRDKMYELIDLEHKLSDDLADTGTP